MLNTTQASPTAPNPSLMAAAREADVATHGNSGATSAVGSAEIGVRHAAQSAEGEELYLAFRLADEVYAIDILGIREIIEYIKPTGVPMMPASVRGVINLRGAVVPVIDLAVRFGREATGVGKRTCFVIVEARHEGATHVLGLMVDGVNAVLNIAADSIEPAPAFGAGVNTDFIAGMARVNGRFVIILDIARVLSIEEMAAIKSAASTASKAA